MAAPMMKSAPPTARILKKPRMSGLPSGCGQAREAKTGPLTYLEAVILSGHGLPCPCFLYGQSERRGMQSLFDQTNWGLRQENPSFVECGPRGYDRE